jgi:hypothetical protein
MLGRNGEDLAHDALAAHALLRAIDDEMAKARTYKSVYARIKQRAASYHARLMKGETI